MKKIRYIGYVVIDVVVIVYLIMYAKSLFDEHSSDGVFEEYYTKIAEENNFYSGLIEKLGDDDQTLSPYIPEGFNYSFGTVDIGYVIEDEQGNQFVWVPCNKNNLYKRDFVDNPFIEYVNCWDNNYEYFLASALENGGFYISRFETGIEDEKIVSKYGAEIFSNVTRNELVAKINEMYNTDAFTCELINGYAYDRAISWILDDTKVELYDNEIEADEVPVTGKAEYKNIYDLFDDMYEITSENYLNCMVYRGFTDINVILTSDIDSVHNEMYDNRFVADEQYTYEAINKTGRLVLYK